MNFNSNPKKIEIALLSKKFDSLEINRLNDMLKIYTLPNSQLIIKQNTQDLKKEILAELKRTNNSITNDDIQINNLSKKLEKYQLYNQEFINDIAIIFPEIENYSVGLQNHIISKDSVLEKPLFVYNADKEVDTLKLKKWLIQKWNFEKVDIQRLNNLKVNQ